MNLYIRAGYRFRCFNSISILDFYFFIPFSEYSFNTKVMDFLKIITVNSLNLVN